MSPDTKAYLTDYLVEDTEYYRQGTRAETGNAGTLGSPGEGEHFYAYERSGEVPIERWEVVHAYSHCIHNQYPSENPYHGITYGKAQCGSSYFSGWVGYCADCRNRAVDFLVYMSADTAKNFSVIRTGYDYLYLCPNCRNLEQARPFPTHICQGISANRYYVVYDANGGSGDMQPSIHYYGNAVVYEGQEVTPKTHLSACLFERPGYRFISWNTRPDGSGASFTDRQEIYNLTAAENGRVRLYAQWKPCSSKVLIETGGGKYDGEENPIWSGGYGEKRRILPAKITPPKGYLVRFDCQGGRSVESMQSRLAFDRVVPGTVFFGTLEGNEYCFSGREDQTDRLVLQYREEGILLPDTEKSGFLFAGWYLDKEQTIPAGKAGDLFMPGMDRVLYAKFVSLQLEASDNYTAYGGSGAADLRWTQMDGGGKIYRVFQRPEGGQFQQIKNLTGEQEQGKVNYSFSARGKEQVLKITADGFYTVTLSGAQGQGHSDKRSASGGKGGTCTGRLFLRRGEILRIIVGGTGEGGKGDPFGNGGGYSMVTSDAKGILLIAGGGGGAGYGADGLPGGRLSETIGNQSGQSGASGGGGGAEGGSAGEAQIHTHTPECVHRHEGNSVTGGGCYRKPQLCDSVSFFRKKTGEYFYYGNIELRDGEYQSCYCVRCGSYDCDGHWDEFYVYICNGCQKEYAVCPTVCREVTGYSLSCGIPAVVCPWEEGEVLYSRPGNGGTSYINKKWMASFSHQEGANTGNGFCRIEGEIGDYISENRLDAVPAKDLMKPGMVTEVKETPKRNGKLEIEITCPPDYGTAYEHQVKSYDPVSGKELCSSNITHQVLISTVKGYHYVMDSAPETAVRQSDPFLARTGKVQTLTIDLTEEKRYLHIAAIDKAGNLGDTKHIVLWKRSELTWPVGTDRIKIRRGSNVYEQEDGVFYVQADGKTKFVVEAQAFLMGNARTSYMVNEIWLNSSETDKERMIRLRVPDSMRQGGAFTYAVNETELYFASNNILEDASYLKAVRSGEGCVLDWTQGFFFPSQEDGRKIYLWPRACAGGREKEYSEEETDREHGIWIIGDAKGPDIDGFSEIEKLAEEENIGRREIPLQASDSGAGLKEFYVKVINMEMHQERIFQAGENGCLTLIVDEADPLYQGNFQVVAYASDRVSNQTVLSQNGLGVSLQAYLERILSPHQPVFRKGESGKITILATGFVSGITVLFPEEFVRVNPLLNQEYILSPPINYYEKEYTFMVPLEVADGLYEIEVRGYKEGSGIESRPCILQLEVKDSVVSQFHTRLR